MIPLQGENSVSQRLLENNCQDAAAFASTEKFKQSQKIYFVSCAHYRLKEPKRRVDFFDLKAIKRSFKINCLFYHQWKSLSKKTNPSVSQLIDDTQAQGPNLSLYRTIFCCYLLDNQSINSYVFPALLAKTQTKGNFCQALFTLFMFENTDICGNLSCYSFNVYYRTVYSDVTKKQVFMNIYCSSLQATIYIL